MQRATVPSQGRPPTSCQFEIRLQIEVLDPVPVRANAQIASWESHNFQMLALFQILPRPTIS